MNIMQIVFPQTYLSKKDAVWKIFNEPRDVGEQPVRTNVCPNRRS
jgi:hypothetical protein